MAVHKTPTLTLLYAQIQCAGLEGNKVEKTELTFRTEMKRKFASAAATCHVLPVKVWEGRKDKK